MGNFFIEGIRHITDFDGYDHMLFLVALCAPFTIQQWKSVLLLATAFTLGHSISLALAALKIIHFSADLIELLIPVTILFTSITNLVQLKWQREMGIGRYLITLIFGVVHGMGFSSYFRMLFDDTKDIFFFLIQFNLGVEIGQIIIISILLLATFILVKIGIRHKRITVVSSVLAGLLSLYLIIGMLFIK